MIRATIYEAGEFFATTELETNDSFHALTWAHRMGWDVLEFSGTSAKLITASGIAGMLTIEFI